MVKHAKEAQRRNRHTLTPPTMGSLAMRGRMLMRTRPCRLMSDTPTRIPSHSAISCPMPSGTGRLGSGLICATPSYKHHFSGPHPPQRKLDSFGLHLWSCLRGTEATASARRELNVLLSTQCLIRCDVGCGLLSYLKPNLFLMSHASRSSTTAEWQASQD